MTKFYMIEEMHVAALRKVKSRLFTETRMNGDEMRGAAQAIDAVVKRHGDGDSE